METTLFEVSLLDGRIFRVFCRGKNQKKRFNKVLSSLTNLDTIKEITNGIHTMEEFNEHIEREIKWFNSPKENENNNGYSKDDFIITEL